VKLPAQVVTGHVSSGRDHMRVCVLIKIKIKYLFMRYHSLESRLTTDASAKRHCTVGERG
jgi:hypothetical protein